MELDRIPLWRGDHVSIKQLVDDFSRYLYLPRLRDPSVLLNAIQSGLGLLSWEQDSFAYAESYDEAAGRYRGLQFGRNVPGIDVDAPGLLVKAEAVRRELEAERARTQAEAATSTAPGSSMDDRPASEEGALGVPGLAPPPPRPRRFHATVTLDANRVGRDASKVAEEVVSHLAGLVGADVKVSLEIEAHVPAGVPENVVRTVTENCRTLKFTTHAFETE
jgi:hypothetical protein